MSKECRKPDCQKSLCIGYHQIEGRPKKSWKDGVPKTLSSGDVTENHWNKTSDKERKNILNEAGRVSRGPDNGNLDHNLIHD